MIEVMGAIKDLNNRFTIGSVVTEVHSLSWTEYFSDVGTFELKLPYTEKNLELVQAFPYYAISSSNRIMRARKIHVVNSKDPVITISGSSLEFILGYRPIRVRSIDLSPNDDVMIAPRGQSSWNSVMRQLYVNSTRDSSSQHASLQANRIRGVDTLRPHYQMYNLYPDTPRDMDDSIYVEGGTTLLEGLKQLSKMSGVGFRYTVHKPSGQLYFDNYSTVDRTDSVGNAVLFSIDNYTLSDVEYLYTEEDEYNGIIATSNNTVKSNANSHRYTSNTPMGLVSSDDFTRWIQYQRIDYERVKEDENDSRSSAKVFVDHATEFFSSIPDMEYVEGEATQFSKYTYDEDYLLGDLVYVDTPVLGYVKARVTGQTFIMDETGSRAFPILSYDP